MYPRVKPSLCGLLLNTTIYKDNLWSLYKGDHEDFLLMRSATLAKIAKVADLIN